jgi:hypothetical protein
MLVFDFRGGFYWGDNREAGSFEHLINFEIAVQ